MPFHKYSITEVLFKEYKDHILSLRQKVWEQADDLLMQQIFSNGFYDEPDDYAFHWGAFDNDKRLIASARLSKHYNIDTLPDFNLLPDISALNINFPIASLNRLTVDTYYQGNGLSKQFDYIRILKAKEIGCNSICGMTHGRRCSELEKFGFHFLIDIDFSQRTSNPYVNSLRKGLFYKQI